MMKIDAQLGTTTSRIVVDLDTQFVSFGPDSDSVYCWICASADAMSDGAYLVKGEHRDGRRDWQDAERYWVQPPVPSYMTDGRRNTVVCKGCAAGQPGAKRIRTLAAKH